MLNSILSQQNLRNLVEAASYRTNKLHWNVFVPGPGTFGILRASYLVKAKKVPETRTTAIALRTENARANGLLLATGTIFTRAGVWATDTAQEFGALVAALMGPAVFSAYAVAIWSLAQDLGWTNTFFFTSGPLSNWLIWALLAVLVNAAATVLRRHTQQGH